MRSRLKRYRSLYPVSTIRLPFAGIDRQNDKRRLRPQSAACPYGTSERRFPKQLDFRLGLIRVDDCCLQLRANFSHVDSTHVSVL